MEFTEEHKDLIASQCFIEAIMKGVKEGDVICEFICKMIGMYLQATYNEINQSQICNTESFIESQKRALGVCMDELKLMQKSVYENSKTRQS